MYIMSGYLHNIKYLDNVWVLEDADFLKNINFSRFCKTFHILYIKLAT